MDKKALMDYALYARRELETQIALSLNKLGIYKDRNAKCNIVGERTVIEGVEQTFPKNVYELRNRIISEHISVDGFDVVVEEFAYTWFNRIIALRFMEVHDYFPHGFRVLTARGGGYEPEILRNLFYVAADLELDMAKVDSYKSTGDDDELYRYVLFSQCNALSEILPMLFDRQQEYMELLLPRNLLSQNSVIRKIVDIPEEDFLNDVEVIGWLYQFYNSVKKDEVYASKEIITKDTLPAVTQLFTPDWIVRYMAQNSVGRIWLESYPDSSLKDEMKYYVDAANQEPAVTEKLERIKYKNLSPEEILIMEPCCGSGHILVYVFDLLYKMYLEKGYNRRDIPGYIFSKNLYGLDVDKRAVQLSQFSLMMKARSIDPRFFNQDRIVIPNVFEILDSKSFGKTNYHEQLQSFGFSPHSKSVLEYLISTFINGKVIGSLLRVRNEDYSRVKLEVSEKIYNYLADTTQLDFQIRLLPQLAKLCDLASAMCKQYDVVITNPPYRETGNLEAEAKSYFAKNYPSSKNDMMVMFMETNLVKKDGFTAMINLPSWMFLGGYEQFRKKLLFESTFYSLLFMGRGVFGSDFGSEAFVFRKSTIPNYIGTFRKLYERQGSVDNLETKEKNFLSKMGEYKSKQDDFLYLPGNNFAFWMSPKMIESFKKGEPLGRFAKVCKGLDTCDNDRFVRSWYEVPFHKIGFNITSESNTANYVWAPYCKGGEYRKWYGNLEKVVLYENSGEAVKNFKDSNGKLKSRPQNITYYFKEGGTFNGISITYRAIRYMNNCVFGGGGNGLFALSQIPLPSLIGFTNSAVASSILKLINPTVNFLVGDLLNIPVFPESLQSERLIELCNSCIKIEKEDWDMYETSWDFSKHPLIGGFSKIQEAYESLVERIKKARQSLKAYEEEINEFFITKYGLETELTKTVPEEEITLSTIDPKRDITSLISYLIGILMGRYSLKKEGIIYADPQIDPNDFDQYVDADGVISLYRFTGMSDGLTAALERLIKCIYGEEHLENNLSFIAENLDPKAGEGSREIINDYLNDSFYQDHTKTYQKKPIYWLMSSGKHGAFRCLLYMHRYNKNTLALINSKYFLPRTAMYKAERERLQGRIDSGLLDSRELREVRKQLDEVLACEQELLEYGQVLDHMANQYIDIDLDDGVKVNYAKFQGVELEIDGRTLKKDLFVPIK